MSFTKGGFSSGKAMWGISKQQKIPGIPTKSKGWYSSDLKKHKGGADVERGVLKWK